MEGLTKEWQKLWSEVGGKGKGMVPLADLVSRWSEPWRAYHTLDHLQEMLAELGHCPHRFAAQEGYCVHFDQTAIQMAIWYHDAVYSTQAKDNEERSADLFRVMAGRYRLGVDFTDRVVFLIEATKHARVLDDLNARALCDIDLAILGKSEFDFDEYERQIRDEYNWVPEAQFREKRAEILQSFLKRKNIYSTQFFQKKYEERARKNLARSIERLKPPASVPDPGEDDGGGLFSKSSTSTGTGGLFSRD